MTSRRTDVTVISSALDRARRRLMITLVLRELCVAAAFALVGSECLVLFGAPVVPTPSLRWALAALWTVGLSVMAAFRFFYLCPQRRQIASLIDRRLCLNEKLVTAAQFLDQPDAFAQLVRRDASAALSGFRPSVVFPFETPRVAWSALIVALVLPAIFVTGVALRRHDWNRAVRDVATAAGLSIPVATASDGARTAVAQPRSPASQDDLRVRRGLDLPPRPAAGAARPSTAGNQSPSHNPLNGDRSASGSAADRTRHVADGSVAQAGGVGQGALAGSSAIAPAPLTRVEDTAGYRSAWSRAQSAVSIDRVPADRRSLVKQYFAAVQPQESR